MNICCSSRFYIYCIFLGTFFVVFLILFCLLIYFTLNFRFTFHQVLLTILFNNHTAYFWRNTLSFAWLKARYKMFLFCISGGFYLLNTFSTKIFRCSLKNRFIKRLHVHDVIFVWSTLIGCFASFQNVIGWIIFKVVTS